MHHLIPQAPCLVTSSGEWAADYVVRTERLQEDMREVRLPPGQRTPCPVATVHAHQASSSAVCPPCCTAPELLFYLPCQLKSATAPTLDQCLHALMLPWRRCLTR